MTKPDHPGAHFARAIKALDVTAYECAKAINVGAPRIYELAKCKTSVSPSIALRLARYLGGSAEDWLQLQARYDLAVAEAELRKDLRAITPHPSAKKAQPQGR